MFSILAPARRGDLEILGYVMLQWLCNRLPWEDNLNDKEYVKRQKIKYVNYKISETLELYFTCNNPGILV